MARESCCQLKWWKNRRKKGWKSAKSQRRNRVKSNHKSLNHRRQILLRKRRMKSQKEMEKVLRRSKPRSSRSRNSLLSMSRISKLLVEKKISTRLIKSSSSSINSTKSLDVSKLSFKTLRQNRLRISLTNLSPSRKSKIRLRK